MTDPSASVNRMVTPPSVLNLFRLDGKGAVVTVSDPAARARPVRPESIRRTEDWAMAMQAWPAAGATSEELIRVQATAARVACGRMTTLALQALRDSVERASCLPSRPRWESKVAAHAEIFQLLADAAGSPAATDPKSSQVRVIRDMMRTVGPVANGIITGSRRRLLACLNAGNADGAAQEMESHLRALHFMALLVPHQ